MVVADQILDRDDIRDVLDPDEQSATMTGARLVDVTSTNARPVSIPSVSSVTL